MRYDHRSIEPKWQERWEKEGTFHVADTHRALDNYYLLVEFPYPSGSLHVGHWYAFSVPDIFARWQRMRERNVLFPIGFDAFGLPAENAALKHGLSPREWTYSNIAHMRDQLRSMGASFDWSREVVTCDPLYYRWTQWLFLQFFKAGLAYQAATAVNWCPSCKTVLANEQVIQGLCERCESTVEQRKMKQWLLKITDYAEKLLKGLEALDWPEEICSAQRNWIGRSEGALIKFKVITSRHSERSEESPTNVGPHTRETTTTAQGDGVGEIEVFTTRPDTLFGATYIVLAPEHPFVASLLKLKAQSSKLKNKEEVEDYLQKSKRKTELERGALQKEKTGVELKGVKAINPATSEEIPIWVADYVLMGYGTGAIMAVPAHDERDFEFARKFGLPVREVIQPVGVAQARHVTVGARHALPLQEAYAGEGVLVSSGSFTGLDSSVVRAKIIKWLEKEDKGMRKVTYKLRDWLISRQRYWGCPIPIIHCQKCGAVPVPEKELPVELPVLEDYKPRDDGRSPLAKAVEWVKVQCPQCGGDAERETDTLDTFVDSSWYFLRYTDPKSAREFAAREKLAAWMPVDLYSGGAEHTTMHLLYSRFWIKAMHALGLIAWDEPYLRRMNRGIILGPDGQKMSKSHGNVVDPDDQVARLGADTVRLYLAFIGPYAEVGAYPWSMSSIVGMRRFLERVWALQEKFKVKSLKLKVGADGRSPVHVKDAHLRRLAHQTIKKVTDDIESFKFNTAIAQLMTFTNEVGDLNQDDPDLLPLYELLLVLLSPFAPHITEELWERLGHTHMLACVRWPQYDPKELKSEEVMIVVQVNGRKRGVVQVDAGAEEGKVVEMARQDPSVAKYLAGKNVEKTVYVKGKILNLVTQG